MAELGLAGGLAGMSVHAVFGDWDEFVGRPPLAWTFEDSEPWVEVWANGKRFEVKPRIA